MLTPDAMAVRIGSHLVLTDSAGIESESAADPGRERFDELTEQAVEQARRELEPS